MALPAWLALSVQVPTFSTVAVFPDTVQTLVVVDVKTTGLPEPPPVALSAIVLPVLYVVGVAGENPVMVCVINAAAGLATSDTADKTSKRNQICMNVIGNKSAGAWVCAGGALH